MIDHYEQVALPSLDLSPFKALCAAWGVNLSEPWPDEFGCYLNKWAKKRASPKIRTLSLFSGAGGLDIGFHDAGFDIVEMVEINPAYAQTLDANVKSSGYFASGIVRNVDIRDYHPLRQGLHAGSIDLIIGGPPCQTFSAGGRRAGGVTGTSEKRGVLFEEYVRLLKELQPKAFVFENVYGITGAQEGNAWKNIQEAFASAGYTLFHRVLDAADYGAPQHRERMIIVGVFSHGKYSFPAPTHGPDSPGKTSFYSAGLALKHLTGTPKVVNQKVNGRYSGLLEQIPPGLNYSYFTEKMGHPHPMFAWRSKFSDFLYKADPTRPVKTIKAFCGKYTGPFHWDGRRFSETELKRLQTFPDNYVIKGSPGIVRQQIGNSVPPQLARILAISILDQVFGVRMKMALPSLNADSPLGFRSRKRAMNTLYMHQAKEAIRRLDAKTPKLWQKSHLFNFTLSSGFRLNTEEPNNGCRATIRHMRGNLQILIAHDIHRLQEKFKILVTSATHTPWLLPVKKVWLAGTSLDRQCYVGSWKIFEKWLSENHFKDDLVQLNGYYAYEPSISAKIDFPAGSRPSPFWKSMQLVITGTLTRKIIAEQELATAFGVSLSQLKPILLELRTFGYEVRSSATNPQIPENHYLIPYSFPTFTHRSVQFHKELF